MTQGGGKKETLPRREKSSRSIRFLPLLTQTGGDTLDWVQPAIFSSCVAGSITALWCCSREELHLQQAFSWAFKLS